MDASQKIERVRDGLRDLFTLGVEMNKGFNQATQEYDFYSRTLDSDFADRSGISSSQIQGILDILQKEKFVLGYSVESSVLHTSPTQETLQHFFVVHFPLSFKETSSDHESQEIFAQITFDLQTRELSYNNELLLARPRFNSVNHQFIEYVYQNPNRKLTTEEIKEHVKPYNGPGQILADLKFVGSLRVMFFLGATIDGVQFRNPLTREEFEKLGISSKQLKSDLMTLSKKVRKGNSRKA